MLIPTTVLTNPSGGGSYTLIQEITAPVGGSATVDFNGIPGTYRQLQLIGLVQTENVAAQNLLVRFNSDTGANYTFQGQFISNAAGTASEGLAQTSTIFAICSGTGESFPMSFTATIPQYAGTSFNKVFHAEWGGFYASHNQLGQFSGTWASTAAITTLTLFSGGSSDIKQGSVFSLYGIS